MELINNKVKKTGNVLKLLGQTQPNTRSGKLIPSRNGNQNNMSFQFDQTNWNSHICAHPPNMYSHTQSDPIGLKRALLANKFPFATPRRKKTANKCTEPARRSKSCLSEPDLNFKGDNFDNNYMTNVNIFPPKFYEKLAMERTNFCKLHSPMKYDKLIVTKKQNEILTKKNRNYSRKKTKNIPYRQIEVSDSEDDDSVKESSTTDYVSSSDYDVYHVKYPKIKVHKPRVLNNKIYCQGDIIKSPYKHSKGPYNMYSPYLKEVDEFCHHNSRTRQKKYQIKQKRQSYKLSKDDLSKLVDLAVRKNRVRKRHCERPKHINTHRLPETNLEYCENYKKNNAFSKCDNHPEVVNRTRNPESHEVRKVLKEKVTDEELWKRFLQKFKSYASTRTYSATMITHELSNCWMRYTGVLDNYISEEEATDAFKKAAGANITMNMYQYKDFLINLTKKRKLPMYEIYRRMCVL